MSFLSKKISVKNEMKIHEPYIVVDQCLWWEQNVWGENDSSSKCTLFYIATSLCYAMYCYTCLWYQSFPTAFITLSKGNTQQADGVSAP